MSYEVLARKWRPSNFSELVGQEHVQRALINALDEDRLHHAYLFTGTRGVGKTTIARIFAKSLNCETGVTSKPCGECSACREIAEGRFVDLIEVDAASRTGVDDTRELLDNVQYAPSRGRYKVYLIDEVHMFSKSSFNALLKTLEEPPPHVKFLLATTDPQKLPVTILSRCLQFNLKRMPVGMIVSHLQHILQTDHIEHDLAALQLLAEGADGSMRDGLSLLDQALAFGGGSVRETDVRDMLGTISRDSVLKITRALFSGDAAAVLAEVDTLAQRAPDFEDVLAGLLSLLHHLALAKTVPEALDDYVSAREQLIALSAQVSAEDIQLFYQIALIGRRDLPLAPDLQSGLEMVLLRMLAFRPVAAPTAPAMTPPASVHNTVPASPSATASAPRAGATTASTESGGGNAVAEIRTQPSVAMSASATSTRAAPVQANSSNWAHIIEQLGINGMVKQLAANCVLKSHAANKIVLTLDASYKQLRNPKAEKRIESALADYFDSEITLHLEMADSQSLPAETPAQHDARSRDERQQQAQRAVENDGFVQLMKTTMNAEIIPGSIRPVETDSQEV